MFIPKAIHFPPIFEFYLGTQSLKKFYGVNKEISCLVPRGAWSECLTESGGGVVFVPGWGGTSPPPSITSGTVTQQGDHLF
jgi:hypothetical protein